MVLLTFKAGLRACKIAGLDWSMVLKPGGRMNSQLLVARQIAKGGSGRCVPFHPELKAALVRLHIARG